MPRLLCVVLAFALLVPSNSAAEPLSVTTGFLIFTDEPGDFLFAGSGFSIAGALYPQTVTGTSWYRVCLPCQPGSTLNFGSSTYTFSREALGGGTINGVTYQELFYDAQVTFHGPTVVAPAPAPDFSTRISGSFTFTGRIAAFANASLSGAPLFSADLQGGGTADIFFGTLVEDSGDLHVTDVDYRFEDQAPVPEPSTLLLLATGLAAAAARRRIRGVRA